VKLQLKNLIGKKAIFLSEDNIKRILKGMIRSAGKAEL